MGKVIFPSGIQAPHRFPKGVTPFALTVHKISPAKAEGVKLNAAVGLGTVVNAASRQGKCSVSGASVNCEFGTLNPNSGGSVSIQLRIESEGELLITADVSGANPAPNPDNNHAEATVAVKKAAEGVLRAPEP